MRVRRSSIIAAICFSLTASAYASWYDDYEAGIKAARAGQWSVVVDRMTRAINASGKESNNARSYGAIFINYHPYYYRAAANLNLGKYEQAVADLEKTSGPGELDLGSIEALMRRAKSALEASNVPPPSETRPQVPQPPQVQTPTVPAVDAALRTRAQNAVNRARSRITAAQQRKATAAPQYANAIQQFTEANTRVATAKSNDDLNAAIALADNAVMLADAATAPVAAATITPPPVQTRPDAATSIVLADSSRKLRKALESYFGGDFEDAARGFEALTRELPNNAWIWAFLGASHYSQYAFEADEQDKAAAVQAFRRAKRLRNWKDGLPDKYFSRRIRKAFRETAG